MDMDILKVVSFALVALIAVVSLKNIKNEFTLYIVIIASIVIILFLLPKLQVVIQFLNVIANKTQIDMTYLTIVFKILGIAYITTFTAELCRDAGVGTLASKVEFGGKIVILTLGIPIIMAVLQSILKFI